MQSVRETLHGVHWPQCVVQRAPMVSRAVGGEAKKTEHAAKA